MTTLAALLAITSIFVLVGGLLVWVQSPTISRIFGERRRVDRREHVEIVARDKRKVNRRQHG